MKQSAAYYVFVVGLVLGTHIVGDVAAVIDQEDTIYMDAMQLVNECGSKDLSLCFKENALRYIENLPSDLELGAGLTIKANAERASRQHQPVTLPDEAAARESAVDQLLLDRILDYFNSHTFEFHIPSDTMRGLQRSMDEEGRKKKKKSMMPFVMLFLLKVVTLGALALKFIGLVAFSALVKAKIALVIAGIIALKKLVEHKPHSSTYEVVAHPHVDEHSFDRSFNQDLAYKGYSSGLRS